MPSKSEIDKIKSMSAAGKSINSISEKLDIPKSTVYYHFRKEVGQKQKENQIKIPADDEIIGEICGVFAGDGNYYQDKNYKYRIRFTLNINQSYWKHLKEFLEENLNKKPHVNPQEEYNRTNLRYESKRLLKLLQKYLNWKKRDKTGTIQLKNKEFSQKFEVGFLRGLMDTDGSKTGNCYRYGSVSKNLMKNCSSILNKLEIRHNFRTQKDPRKNCRTMYRVNIYQDKEELLDRVNPRHPKKL